MICAVTECDKEARRRGWCGAHYKRWCRHGDPLAGGTSPGAWREWLADKITSGPPHECWVWPFARSSHGYAIANIDRRRTRITRWLLSQAGEVVTDDLVVLHSCDNPPCVNPAHLSLGTQTENMQDALAKRRTPVGEACSWASLTEEQVAEIRRGVESSRVAAVRYGVSASHIRRLRRGERWKHPRQPNEESSTCPAES